MQQRYHRLLPQVQCRSFDLQTINRTAKSKHRFDEKRPAPTSHKFWSQVSNAANKTYSRARSCIVGRPKGATAPAPNTSRTASYDGLRGIACLIVFNFHFLYPYIPGLSRMASEEATRTSRTISLISFPSSACSSVDERW